MIYLVQHGKAFDERVDPERSLTPEGIEESRRVATHLAKVGVKVAVVYHSGKKRARQTAEIFAQVLGARAEEKDGLNPNDDPAIWAERLSTLDEVMIVGHLPHLSRLASLLVVGNTEVPIVEFRYSGVVALTRTPKWVVKWLLTPDILP
ncbi:phosphohistidine phosphatase SixA [Pyrobaculum calidifontis]|uniref:Phosphohistidine phosphatase, SixA n=1 Tax=Pyrobaculum calidifontis (strain DSM 21063 / JCM 11548 / VA1) TaxID=410359 RepID=A3MSH6_PYRCJ|nr:phosphohistidine phosphatase SixA [Pyrobaculum calidifontis]ABO07593.1 phosphohistidine phosphatase, SixA [Pyrobaculum calidifontis JCM 11548]